MSTDLKSQIHSYGTQLVDSQTPITEADVADLLGKVRHLPPTPVPVYPKSRWRIAVAAGIAVLVLFGVMSLLTVGNETGNPPATDPPPVTTVTSPPTTTAALDEVPPWSGLTEDIPEGVESGTVTTPLGSARWVHLNSDEYLLPSLGPLTRNLDHGYIVDGLEIFVASDSQWELWKSDDGITWRGEIGTPTHAFNWPVPHVDGSYELLWFINTDPLEVEYSEGAQGSGPDLSGLVPPESDGFTWTLEVSKPLSRYTYGNQEAQDLLHVRFSGPDGQVDQRLLVIERSNPGDRATYQNVPWEVDSDVSLFGTSETLFAYVGDPNSNQISVWQSNDGYLWTESGGLHEQLGAPASPSLKLTVLPAVDPRGHPLIPMRNQMVVATTPGSGWESSDGVNWTPAPDGFPGDTDLIRLESGWFATDGDAWWMHLGDSWVSLADLGMERAGDGCQIVPRGAEQTTVFFSTGTCTPDSSQHSTTDLWIIDVDS